MASLFPVWASAIKIEYGREGKSAFSEPDAAQNLDGPAFILSNSVKGGNSPLTAESYASEAILVGGGQGTKANGGAETVKAGGSKVKFAMKYSVLIECLAKHESGNDQSQIGKAGEIGCMQFLPTTFNTFKKRFGMDVSINSCEDQKILADRILTENFADLKHWTTRKFCQ